MSPAQRFLDPRVASDLARLRRRVKRLAFAHGAGMWLVATAALLVGSFYFDRLLNPPHAMRLVVAPLVWIALGASFVWWVVRRTRVKVTDEDAALLVERTYPEIGERLITAVQLTRGDAAGAPALVERAIAEGEEAALRVDFRRAVRPGRARAWGAFGFLAFAAGCAVALREPQDTAVFWARLLGMAVEFPQRTKLDLDIPILAANVRVARAGDVIRVRMAKGSDLAVRAVAEGEAPPIVELVTSEGRRVPMGQLGTHEYLARFHAVKGGFAFHAEGGDDRDESPRVEVETVTPPALAKIRVRVTPPPYSAQAAFEREGGSFEALAGASALVLVETTAPVRRATLRWRGSDESIPFAPREVVGDAAAASATQLSAEFVVERNARYSVELEDAEGLRNPDPGSYSVVALTDRAPEVKLQAPARTEVDLTPGGTLPLQARAIDDFGVTTMRLRARIGNAGEFREIALPLAARAGEAPSSAPANANDPTKAPKVGVARLRLDVASLRSRPADAPGGEAAERAPAERDVVELFVEALDTRNPKPGTGESLHVRGVVMAPTDVLKRITERFSRAKETVQSLLDIQNERRRRVAELLGAVPGDATARQSSERAALGSILVGQNRVTTDSRVLVREFFECFETAAGNRLDRTGDAVSAALDRLRAASPAAFDDPYTAEVGKALVAELRSGALGAPEFLGKLGDLLHEAAAIATDASPGAASALDGAALAVDPKAVADALERALRNQDAAIASLERLLGMLSEWANFQDVITLTKEILDQQKTLEAKTKEAATGKPAK